MVSKNILVIHQQSGFRSFDQSLDVLKYITSRLTMNYTDINFVIADNEIKTIKTNGNIHVIPCGNQYREFSGWESGLDYGKGLMGSQSFNLILSNETMLNHRPVDAALLNAFIATFNTCFRSSEACYAGDLDEINASPPYYHSNQSEYISTYLCAMNWKALQLINTIIPKLEYEKNFIKYFNCDTVISNDSSIKNTSYGIMLEGYLYKNISGLSIKKWWDHNKLNKKNYEKFRLKMLSILIEHGIAQNLQKNGCALENVKKNILRSPIKKSLFFFKRLKFSFQWRIRRYIKKINGSL